LFGNKRLHISTSCFNYTIPVDTGQANMK